ncbi:MAG: type II and III secretion system protein, partial [Gammaproteobacteria bacterium]
MKCNRKVLLFLLVAVLIGCSGIGDVAHPIDFQVEQRHITAPEVIPAEQIPEIVTSLPVITAPQPEAPQELYSVVVQDVPVRELLFAMARDADINIDVPATISGAVSINAIDQTLPQILSRISRQVPIRWNFERSNYLVVEADLPYFRNYRIDYVN